MSANMRVDDDQDECCPLCMEELDLTDKTFNACPCGYQICLWCWHQIKNEYNGLCPACRAPYAELTKQKAPLDREDVIRRTKQRKQKEKSERRSSSQSRGTTINRKNLANVRVMQRNLVYVIGLPPKFADDDILRSNEGLGQYGKIIKAVVNKSHLNSDRANATASAYITFANKEDALACILAIDGYLLDGSVLRASFGTTKYCNFFLRNMQCNNPDCLYLHELGEQEDSFTKEEMQAALHTGKAAFRDLPHSGHEMRSGSRFPPAYRSSDDDDADYSVAPTDAQRQAQSAAAVHKLRQSNGGPSKPMTHSVKRQDSYSRIVAGSGDTSSVSSSVSSPQSKCSDQGDITRSPSPNNSRTSDLRVDTTPAKPSADTVVGPLEALKLVASQASQEPAWAQPFPSPAIVEQEQEDVGSVVDSLFTPFGLGFAGGLGTHTQAADSSWGDVKPGRNNSIPIATDPSRSIRRDEGPAFDRPSPFSNRSSESAFASIDAIFNQRSESSEALAGLLGVHLSDTPLVHGGPPHGGAPSKGSHTSRFAFANAPALGPPRSRQPPLAPPVSSDPFGFPAFGRSASLPPPMPSASLTPLSASDPFGTFGSGPSMNPLNRMMSDSFDDSGLGFGASGKDSAASGLAFLQQMLPNVNISYGGEYAGQSRNDATNLQSMGGGGGIGAWGGDDLGSGLHLPPHAKAPPSSLPFHDPALVGASSLGGFYGFGGAEQDDERRLQVPFN